MMVDLMGIAADDLQRPQVAELRMVNPDLTWCRGGVATHPCAADRSTISATAGESCW